MKNRWLILALCISQLHTNRTASPDYTKEQIEQIAQSVQNKEKWDNLTPEQKYVAQKMIKSQQWHTVDYASETRMPWDTRTDIRVLKHRKPVCCCCNDCVVA